LFVEQQLNQITEWMSKVTGILGSSVIKQKMKRYWKSWSKRKSSPWPLAGGIQYLSGRCIACVCCALALEKYIELAHSLVFFLIFCPSWEKTDITSRLATCKKSI